MKTAILPSFLALTVAIVFANPVRADQFLNGQAADVVLGQPDFVTNGPNGRPERHQFPSSVFRDPTTGKVFVGDRGHYRVLRYSSAAAARSGSDPEAVFGQTNFNSFASNQGGGISRSGLTFFYQIFVDHRGRLWVADRDNNRVLCWFAASFRGSGEDADYVFGQPGFTTDGTGDAANEMSGPSGVWVTPGDVLWVADSNNSRVLRFDAVSGKTNGAAADVVLGQTGFDLSGIATSQGRMRFPYSVSVDSSGRLWVADSFNNRVLRFDGAAGLNNGALADGVLGQLGFDTRTADRTANRFTSPFGVFAAADGTVWVGDTTNHRVLGFANAAALPPNSSATIVLGQPDFTTSNATVDARTMRQPENLGAGPGGSLLVGDSGRNRVLRFSPFRTPTLRFTRARAVSRRPVYTARGLATEVVSRVRVRLGASAFRTAQGTNAWSARVRLRPGRNTLFAIAEGPGGTSALARQTVVYNASRNRR